MEQYDVDVHQMFTDFKQTYDSVYTSVLYKILVELKPANKVLQNLDCNMAMGCPYGSQLYECQKNSQSLLKRKVENKRPPENLDTNGRRGVQRMLHAARFPNLRTQSYD